MAVKSPEGASIFNSPNSTVGLPGFGPSAATGDMDWSKYRVRYKKFNLDDVKFDDKNPVN